MTIVMMPSRGVICFIALLGGMIALGQAAQAQSTIKLVGDPVRGGELAETCASCHGNDGMGYSEGIPRIVGQSSSYLRSQLLLFRNSAWLRTDEMGNEAGEGLAYLKSAARSFSGMDDAVLGLTDQDIMDVAAYYGTLKCSPSGMPQPVRPATINRCDACHGKDGKKISRNQPSLASQHAVYLRRQLKFFRAAKTMDDFDLTAKGGSRYNRIMSAQSQLLTDSMIAEIAAYYESVPCE